MRFPVFTRNFIFLKYLVPHTPLQILCCAAMVSSQIYFMRPALSPALSQQMVSPKTATTPIDSFGELENQGEHRTYYLHTPVSDKNDRPRPLVLALHESAGKGKTMADNTGLNQLADRSNFIIAYPDALKGKWNVSGRSLENNVTFIHDLITELKIKSAIDSQRIYIVGLSNGGILAQKLACENPDGIAAVVTVAASLPIQFQDHCQSHTSVSMMMINGTADDIVPWEGGSPPMVSVGRGLSIPPIVDVIDFWQQHNHCTTTLNIKQRDDDRVEESNYVTCESASEVSLVALKGAGHVWCGGNYGSSEYLDAGETAWAFFQRHTLSQLKS